MTSSPTAPGRSPMMPSPSRRAAQGLVVGALGGLCVALGDFGASWLWLPWWADRVGLGLRLLALEVPLGALAGFFLGALADVASSPLARAAAALGRGDADRTRRWAARLAPLPLLVPALPGLLAVAVLLFSGGSMSRLPALPALQSVTGAVLVTGGWGLLRLGGALHRASATLAPRQGRLLGAGLLGVHFALSKVDQLLFPKLYQYLHAGLAVAAWLVACLAVAVLALHVPRLRWVHRPPRGLAPLGACLAVAVLTFDLITLDANPNVRVALFDARAASSRSIMLGLAPLLDRPAAERASASAIESAQRARALRQTGAPTAAVTTLRDAHVLLVTIDALRADHLGAYGYGRGLSPGIDALASEAVVFERAYAAAPHSSYSLCSMMVSDYLRESVEMGLPLPEATLATAAAEHGYHTAGFFTLGIFHTEGERLTPYQEGVFGFARHDHANYEAEAQTDAVLAEIDRIASRGEPSSLIWTHYFDVHEPYQDTSLGTSDMDRYDGEIRHVDRELSRLLAEARRRLRRPIIIVITADHGEEFRDHGGVYHGSSLYEEQIRVPLIVHVPGLPARRVTDAVELVDLAPTLLGLLELPEPSTMRGDDLRPAMEGEPQELGPAFASVSQNRMVVRWPHKLVADLRFHLFELYDLETDPGERVNLAAQKPELVDALTGEIYAWLDSLAPDDGADDPRKVALERGRLGDPRAVEPLVQLLSDGEASADMRAEACRILGQLSDDRATAPLLAAMRSDDPAVAAEAAVALGRMYDARAKPALEGLVFSESPDLRSRAAVSLARLRDSRAVPSLIDALYVSTDRYEREEAVRWLGRLRDPRAVEPLIQLIPEFRIRYLTVVALGQLGDPRAYEPLVRMLEWEDHTNVRDNVTRALGQLGDRRAIGPVLAAALAEPSLKYAPEALVRLGAVATGAIGGADVTRGGRGQVGFSECTVGPLFHDWDYNARTYCVSRGPRVRLRLAVPPAVADAEELVVLTRVRLATDGPPAMLRIRIGDQELPPFEVTSSWRQQRSVLPAGALPRGSVPAYVEMEGSGAAFAVDHLLLLPSPPPQDS